MPGTKQELLSLMRRCALLMELNGENPFRCRAFENAARVLEGIEGEPDAWLSEGRLEGVKGVGKGIRDHVREYVETGRVALHDEMAAAIPAGVIEMSLIPGLGTKKIQTLWKTLGIASVADLRAACDDGRVAALKGFGAKTAENICAGIERIALFSGRSLAHKARGEAERIVALLKADPSVRRIEVAGSLRRWRETVKDLDLLADSDEPESVMARFVGAPGVARVTGHGKTKSSIVLASGLAADLRVVPAESFGAALMYFTGSKEHNTHLRGRAKKMGMRLNEYGLYKDDDLETPLPCPTEEAIYKTLGLPWIEPELREDRGEIEAAERGELPNLIRREDMRGLLHCHSQWSDGADTIEDMAQSAKDAGFEYFGICDHSQTAAYAGGLKPEGVFEQHKEIDKLNQKLQGMVVLKGIESDILGDGALDYDDEVLASFDFVVASVHSRMKMPRDEMTRRVVAAVEHPRTCILGHMTGRLLLKRDPFDIDLDAVFEAAARNRVAIEINAHPARLDLDWSFVRQAKRAGCVFAINPDAHNTGEIAHVRYGVGVARKGWLEAGDVINTKTLAEFRAWLQERRAGR